MSGKKTMVSVGGEDVPLNDCDWVLWNPCGCPRGVAMARYFRTEDAAWLSFFGTWKAASLAQRNEQGLRVELMTHERYSAEVFPLMTGACPHKAVGA